MNKLDLVQHLANLTFIMDFHEKLGTTKNVLIVAEFNNCHMQLIQLLEKENETRARNIYPKRPEAGAD